MNKKYLYLLAGYSSTGKVVKEKLPVKRISEYEYKLLISPGLVLGIAKGDIFKYDAKSLKFTITKRSGNLSIQVYKSREFSEKQDDNNIILEVVNQLNGTLDGETNNQFVFSIPVKTGFPKIEKIMNNFVENDPGTEWYYGNVYGEDGQTPLNWWNNED